MRKIDVFIFVLIALTINGCTSFEAQPLLGDTPTSTSIKDTLPHIASRTPTNTLTEPHPRPTSTTKPRPTIKSTPTYIPTLSRDDVPVCQGEGQPIQPSQTFGIDGVLIYQKEGTGLYSVGGHPLSWSQLPVDQSLRYSVFGFSPDGKWLAYSPLLYSDEGHFFDEFTVMLLSTTGGMVENTLDIQGFNNELPPGNRIEVLGPPLSYWIDNRLIYTPFGIKNPSPTVSGYVGQYPNVFDPFNGEWHLELTDSLPGRDHTESIGFSKDLKRALYVAGYNKLILWDLEQNASIWELQDFFVQHFALIEWSPDGNQVVASNGTTPPEYRQTLILSKDGAEIKIIGNSTYPYTNFWPYFIKWSPDSRYLAVIDFNNMLLLFDARENKYMFRCPLPGFEFIPNELVWSPDSRFVAFGAIDESLRIMNIDTGEVVELLQNAAPVGWSATFPVEWP